MSSRFISLICALILGLGSLARAGLTADTPYTIRGQTDFDTALQLLNPYGTWSKIDEKWAFTPSDHQAPYTDGRWLYTEYGWYWKGRLPHSWLTEHYGYWKRRPDKVWSWYPGPYWLPQIVEIRASSQYIGWRSAEVDSDGNFVEAPIDRFAQPDEWTFVTLTQFANPITPDLVAHPDVAKIQLEDSTDCRHTYLTYREIDRPGPHPADFADLSKDGGMLAPLSLRDQTLRDQLASAAGNHAPSTPATNNAAAIMNGTNAPALIGAEIDPTADTRKVKYWITMSLPTFWTPAPPDAKPDQIYLYRPDFYQDEDGIARRITLWFNPKAHTSLADLLGDGATGTKTTAATGPATPAVSASGDGSNPFRSPLDEPVHSSSPPHASSSSSKNPVPTGLSTPENPTVPAGTNNAPAK